MTRMTTSEARKDFAGLLERAGQGERVVLDRHGKPVAAIISVEDLALLERLEDLFDRQEARKAKARADREGTVSWEQLKSDVGL